MNTFLVTLSTVEDPALILDGASLSSNAGIERLLECAKHIQSGLMRGTISASQGPSPNDNNEPGTTPDRRSSAESSPNPTH